MGIAKNTVEIVTCDICGHNCGKNDGDICIQVNGGDGRDVPPATITGTLRFTQPYKVSNGILCLFCKTKWLKKYVENL
jgi:hypothetical protein